MRLIRINNRTFYHHHVTSTTDNWRRQFSANNKLDWIERGLI